MNAEFAKIKPSEYENALTGHKLAVKVSPFYSTIHIDKRVYYFAKETGDFDGTSMPMEEES